MAGGRILLVEDEEVIRALCLRLLAGSGFEIATAGTVAEAVEEMRRTPCDLLITDLRLPDGDGVEVITRLREMRGGLKVLVITGSPTPESRLSRVEKMDILGYVAKPFEVDVFVEAVKKAMGGPGGA